MNDKSNNTQSAWKFLLKLLLVFIVVGGVICGIAYLMLMAMFNWDG